jgi:hypothetical protein
MRYKPLNKKKALGKVDVIDFLINHCSIAVNYY